jgi:hypothetical protein
MAAPKLQAVYESATTLLEAQRFYVKPAKVNVFMNLIQAELQNILFGSLFQYRPGQPTPPISAQVTSDVADLLQPYWKTDSLVLTSGAWLFSPAVVRFTKLIDLRPTYESGQTSSVELLTNTQYLDREQSTSKPPTEIEPIAEYFDGGYNVAPTPNQVLMLYYEGPAKVVIPFTGGVPDFENIPDILWSDRALPYLTYLFVSKFGIPLNNPSLVQAGEQLAKMAL